MADLSSPVPAPEDIGEMLYRLMEASADLEICEGNNDPKDRAYWQRNLATARDAIADLVSRLRSQVERMRVEAEDWKASHGHAAKLLMRYREDLLTPEEARVIIEYFDMGGRVERSERAHAIAKSADAKLRRRLSSGDSEQ